MSKGHSTWTKDRSMTIPTGNADQELGAVLRGTVALQKGNSTTSSSNAVTLQVR